MARSNGTSIKGITIQIGGDVSGLDGALKQVNDKIRTTQEDLKQVERLLKLDPKNTELLAQKQRLLGQEVAQTKERLEALKNAEKTVQEQMAKGEVSQDQYEALRRKIIETENSLEDLEKQAAASSVALGKISAVTGKIADGAEKVAQKTKALSAAAAGALAGIGTAAYRVITLSDDLNTLAAQTGFSTAELQKMTYAADRIDVSMETITGAAQKMTKRLSTSEESFADLGVETRNVNGELRDVTHIFYETITALSAVENETERDTLAMDIFGRSANELAGIVDDGGAALRDLGKEAEDLGLILDQDTLDSLNAVNDKLDKLKATAGATLSTSGAKAVEVLEPVIEKVVTSISALLDKIGEMSPEQIERLIVMLAALASISPIAGAIGKLTGAIGGIVDIWPTIAGIGAKVGAFAAANPIVLIAAAVIAFVAILATKGDEIQAILQKVDDWLQGVFARDWTEIFGPVLGEGLNKFFANVSNVCGAVKGIFTGIIDFIRGVFSGDWKRAWEGVKEILRGIWDGLLAVVKAPLNGIISLVNSAIGGLNSFIRGLNKIHFDVPAWVPGLGGKSFGINIGQIGKIPYLANGGILSNGSAIVGEAGPELLTMAGGRAVVQPLTNNTTTNHNLGGVTVNVYGAPGQNVDALADEVMYRIQASVEQKGAAFG